MKIYLVTLSLLMAGWAKAQKIPEVGTNVRLIESDQTIVAEIRSIATPPNIYPEKTYYWYGSNTIHHTQGGFSGHLLNGTYNEFDLQKNLKTQGVFEKGLKNGIWKAWNSNGTLKELLTYRKGLLSGDYNRYNTSGKLSESGRYNDNEKDGKIYFFDGDTVRTTVYKDGKVQAGQQHDSFWAKLNLFKKREKTPSVKAKTAH